MKDEGAKTHPCLVPFDELPEGQQLKDVLLVAIIQTLAPLSAEDASGRSRPPSANEVN